LEVKRIAGIQSTEGRREREREGGKEEERMAACDCADFKDGNMRGRT